jgi:hypothetical protein
MPFPDRATISALNFLCRASSMMPATVVSSLKPAILSFDSCACFSARSLSDGKMIAAEDAIGLETKRSGAEMRHGAKATSVAMAVRILAIAFAVAGAVCWLWPGAIGGLLFHALPVSVRESVIIGALFFVGAAILLFIRPSDGKGP